MRFFMVSPEEVHIYLRLPLDDSWDIVFYALFNWVSAHSLSGRFLMNMRNPCMEETKVSWVVGNPTFWANH